MGGFNPVVSGLLGGFQLAHQIKGERMAQEQITRQEQRDAEDKQVRDLQTQMALSDRGYKPSTPDQDAELLTGLGMGRSAAPYSPAQGGEGDVPQSPVGGIIGGVAAPVKSDIKTRTAKFNGQTYVRPSDDEIDQQSERAGRRALANKVNEARALADVKEQSATKALKERMDTIGVPLSDEKAAEFGVPKGTKLMQGPGFGTELGALMRGSKKDAGDEVAHTYLTRENGGNTISITKKGETRVSGPLGLPDENKRKPGDMTEYQRIQIDRQKATDAAKAEATRVKTQKDAQTQVNKLNAQEQLLHAENRSIGERLLAGSAGTATDKKGKKVQVTAQDATALKSRLADNQTKVKALQDQQHAIIMGFAHDGQQQTQAAPPPSWSGAGFGLPAAAAGGGGGVKAPPSPW